ncbi:DALR anticodon-binding domain-containing protein 3 isoform X1 [Zophobas morio]|uniref:DALR anticodon-binding domain-containing protein 3 isoform X1 n=1 Tax=Zophobas morio TaxID=2755281 RepID=UPI0030833677
MYAIVGFLEDLHEYLTGTRCMHGNIIRKHSKKLELGDISFPLDIKKWSHIINKSKLNEAKTIFDCLEFNQDLNTHLDLLIKASNRWPLVLDSYKIKDNDVHFHLKRFSAISVSIRCVLEQGSNYGFQSKCFESRINLTNDDSVQPDLTKMTLTELRAFTIRDVATNILNNLTSNISFDCDIKITLNSNEKTENVIVCGSVLNDRGVKDTQTTADELYKKRSLDMQLMAQHKYGVQIKPSWRDYFEKLGKASVILEMLQNRTHKSLKITLNSLQTANKGPSFIFYNCARIAALLRQFDDQVANNVYPELPLIDSVDFALLNQAEEWEMVYVFILQFPLVVVNCVSDIKLGVVNLHQLVFFLSSLSSVFSVYYRRVKILTSSKEHLLPVLFARIYLIKAVQQVFHTALHLLNIEPVKEM